MVVNLSTKEASAHINVAEGTLRYWRSRGEGPPAFRLGAKKVLYRKSDLDAWIESQYANTVTGDDAA